MVIKIAKDAMETITTTAADHGGRFASITGASSNAGALFSWPAPSLLSGYDFGKDRRREERVVGDPIGRLIGIPDRSH